MRKDKREEQEDDDRRNPVPVPVQKIVGAMNERMEGWPIITKAPGDPPVVISVTTVPSGVRTLGPLFDSLRKQRYSAFRIDLNLPSKSERGLGIYPDLDPEIAEGITVWRTHDWGTLTNVVPTVQRLQKENLTNALLLVVDDDKVYPETLLEDHIRASRLHSHGAYGCRGWSVPPTQDLDPNAFDELRISVYGNRLGPEMKRVSILTGSDSWSAPVSAFHKDLWEEISSIHKSGNALLEKAVLMVNDVWISGLLSRHGLPKYVMPCHEESWDNPISKCKEAWCSIEYARIGHQMIGRGNLNIILMQYFREDWKKDELMPEGLNRKIQNNPHFHRGYQGAEKPVLPFVTKDSPNKIGAADPAQKFQEKQAAAYDEVSKALQDWKLSLAW